MLTNIFYLKSYLLHVFFPSHACSFSQGKLKARIFGLHHAMRVQMYTQHTYNPFLQKRCEVISGVILNPFRGHHNMRTLQSYIEHVRIFYPIIEIWCTCSFTKVNVDLQEYNF